MNSNERAPWERLTSLRQHRRNGHRSPHKPLLALLALGALESTGSSALAWTEVESQLAGMISEFGRPSGTSPSQSAAFPFTRLRSDRVWVLDRDVPMDAVSPLRGVVGRFEPELEAALRADRDLLRSTARDLVTNQFPTPLAADVLTAAGLDPEAILGAGGAEADPARTRRAAVWRREVIEAWDRQCAFCGYDGQVAGAAVGIDAAHVRWFAFDGPPAADNGLALCVLHHKLFDRGVLGLDQAHRVQVSQCYTARTPAGRALYDLHGRPLSPRPGTPLPAVTHVDWHAREVFKGRPIVC